MNFIIGAAGFAKEVDWLLHDIDGQYRVDHFVAKENIGNMINGSTIISDEEFANLCLKNDSSNVFISMGSPAVKFAVYQRLQQQAKLLFPTIIHPSVLFDKRNGKVAIGEGTILCAGNILTTGITIGSFVHLNLDCTVGHDSSIGDFSTISPGVHISGNVTIGKRVFIGTGAVVLEKISICDDAIIGAGAVVTKPVTEAGTYTGIPAKKIK